MADQESAAALGLVTAVDDGGSSVVIAAKWFLGTVRSSDKSSLADTKENVMTILTAWVETDDGFELVAVAMNEPWSEADFDRAVDNAAIDYDTEPKILVLPVDEALVARLLADPGSEGLSSVGGRP